jgi:tellurium resistance protein TerD
MKGGVNLIQIAYTSKGVIDRNSIDSINQPTASVLSENHHSSGVSQGNMPQMNVSPMLIPQLIHQVQKGQKQSLTGQNLQILDVCLGWNVTNPACDVDVSAFLLDETGKVPGDNWFVFYGQTESPDGSVRFSAQSQNDREEISIHLQQLHPSVKKIVFVLTINDAFEQKRNFSMIRDAYIRIMDHTSRQEIISFKMDEYYQNVISMMIGELYLYNGIWKFHAIGNGVAKDLAGLCQLYGVSVV